MKKFREISEQYREEGRHKLIQPKNKPVVSPRPENDSAKVKLGEAVKDKYDIGEYDQEGDMAKSDLRSIIANSKRVHDMLKDDDNLPEWVQSKITKAEDYMSTVANYLEAEMNEEVEQIDEISAETAKRVAQARDKSAANYKLTPTQSRRLKMKDIGGDPDMNAAKALKSAMKRGAKNVYGEAVKMPKQTGAEKEYRRITGKTVDQRLSELDKIQKDLAKQKEDYIKQGIIKAESVEQIDELKVSTLTRYGTKATQAYGRNPEKDEKRLQGIQRARAKVQQKTMKKEETEVDESIASTIGGAIGQYTGSKIGMDGPGRAHGELAGRMIDYHARKLFKKIKNKVTGQKNESVEIELQELSKELLARYKEKAEKSRNKELGYLRQSKEREKILAHANKYRNRRIGLSRVEDRLKKEDVELDEGKYGAFRVGPKRPKYPYVPQGDRDPRTGLPLGFSNPPKSEKPEEPKKMKEEVESLEEGRFAKEFYKRNSKERTFGKWESHGWKVEANDRGHTVETIPHPKGHDAEYYIAKNKEGKKVGHYDMHSKRGKLSEEVESLEEKNVPTSPEKWSRAKAMAKQKFDVYPSAYANGWAAKKYKEMGGGWKSVSEEVKKDDDVPFKPDAPKKKSVVVGKKPEGYSIARQLARQGMKKYMKPVKEENMSRKAKIVKDALKKSSKEDQFQAEPMISQSIVKNN